MSALDQIININISQNTTAVAQASFSIPLIVGPTANGWSDFVHAYSSPAGMLTDGYTTSSPEYVYALEMFEQPLAPTQFLVGKRSTAVAQQSTLAVGTLVATGHDYSFTLNGVLISYTSSSDTQQSILTALNAAITAAFSPATPPTSGVVTGMGSGALLTLTSTEVGQAFTVSAIDPDLTYVITVPNVGIVTDLQNIIGENNSWYGLVGCAFSDADIVEAAAYIETLKKIYIAISSTSAITTSATTDVASVLKSKSYKRTGLIYTAPSYVAEGKDAAWVGGQLPYTPGANNWAFKTLVGCTPDVLSQSVQAILIGDPVASVPGKNVNIYQTIGGVNITQMGTMAGGQYIDLTVGIDWLQSTIQTNVYSALVNSAKIPYTDKGTGILISAVNAAIQQGVTNGLIDGTQPIVVTAPLVATVPLSQRANRVSPTISFSCTLAGAFNAIVVNGTVTV